MYNKKIFDVTRVQKARSLLRLVSFFRTTQPGLRHSFSAVVALFLATTTHPHPHPHPHHATQYKPFWFKSLVASAVDALSQDGISLGSNVFLIGVSCLHEKMALEAHVVGTSV